MAKRKVGSKATTKASRTAKGAARKGGRAAERPAPSARGAAPKKSGPKSRGGPAGTAQSVRLPRDPKGRRAQFYQDPAIDQLWAVVAALTGEVSVAFDRLDTVERVLDRHGHVTREAIEAYRPDEAASAERAKTRDELIARVFQVLSQYAS